MSSYRVRTDIPVDRKVTIVLPPEAPLGEAELLVTIVPTNDAQQQAGILESHFGAIASGNPVSAENNSIDRDLTSAYQDSDD